MNLARKGKWDTSLFLSAERNFAGDGGLDGQAGYVVSSGVNLVHIDRRISRNLENIALAKIREYRNAVVSRRREIHYDTLEAYSSLETYAAEAETRKVNLVAYYEDFRKGIQQYTEGLITVDEVIQRREAIREEESSIRHAHMEVAESVVNLLTSTGRYEEFLKPAQAAPAKTGNQAQ